MHEIYEPLDEGIAETVHLLRNNGFDTFSSCDGGLGHTFSMPTIRIACETDQLARVRTSLAAVLSDFGYSGYHIKLYYPYQSGPHPWGNENQSFVEVEFWNPKE